MLWPFPLPPFSPPLYQPPSDPPPAEEGNLYYGDVETVVLDEADTMLDRGFGPEVRRVLAAVRGKPRPARCVLVSATVTRGVRALMEAEFPGMLTVQGEGLHRERGGRAPYLPGAGPGTDKMAALAALRVAREAARGRRVMVFANPLASCRAAEHALAAAGLDTACYHGDMPAAARGGLRRFGDARTRPGSHPARGPAGTRAARRRRRGRAGGGRSARPARPGLHRPGGQGPGHPGTCGPCDQLRLPPQPRRLPPPDGTNRPGRGPQVFWGDKAVEYGFWRQPCAV